MSCALPPSGGTELGWIRCSDYTAWAATMADASSTQVPALSAARPVSPPAPACGTCWLGCCSGTPTFRCFSFRDGPSVFRANVTAGLPGQAWGSEALRAPSPVTPGPAAGPRSLSSSP